METNLNDGGQDKEIKSAAEKKASKFVAGNPVNEESVHAGDSGTTEDEPSKMEIKFMLSEKIAEQKAVLEKHIRLGDELARKIKHLDNLKAIITTLNEFEVALKDHLDEPDGNHFQGCQLLIRDDNGKTFITKNPTIIKNVAEQLGSLCAEKLEEVELDIVNLIPA